MGVHHPHAADGRFCVQNNMKKWRSPLPLALGFGAGFAGAFLALGSGSGGVGGGAAGGFRISFEPPSSSVGISGRAPVSGSRFSSAQACICMNQGGVSETLSNLDRSFVVVKPLYPLGSLKSW
jgi:hypothetical protein